jgi:hypothetical protein
MKAHKININKIKLSPENPRLIKDDKFRKLVSSISEFPVMMEIRPIVVDENNVVLGGNMRLQACKELGLKEVWIKKIEDLTEEQKKEFVIKDNASFGEWDWDILANEWDVENLVDWGLDIPKWDNTTTFESGVVDDGQYDYPDDVGEMSHVKMVQLFLSTDTEPDFRKWELHLREVFQTENLTDTVYKVIQKSYIDNHGS